jgi:hypothetical protein
MDFHELRFTQIYNEISFEKPNEPIRPDEIYLGIELPVEKKEK